MTDQQYWEERKRYVKLSHQAFALSNQIGLSDQQLIDILTQKYGVNKIVQLTNDELEDFGKWLIQQKEYCS
ncbi:hypothetical protein [Gloeothece verrucosa]|uniref:hypothetical protein n=1 Tax=Gloeothece verrucosa TaxID=2546359 RepID=UPI0005A533EE|nr:hypothetical protein [Gloeothece verrucosa]